MQLCGVALINAADILPAYPLDFSGGTLLGCEYLATGTGALHLKASFLPEICSQILASSGG